MSVQGHCFPTAAADNLERSPEALQKINFRKDTDDKNNIIKCFHKCFAHKMPHKHKNLWRVEKRDWKKVYLKHTEAIKEPHLVKV